MIRFKTFRKTHRFLLVALLLALMIISGCARDVEEETETIGPSGPPRPQVNSSATIGSTGDILLHTPILDTVFDMQTGTYDFTEVFEKVRPYYEAPDLMVANLEVTLGGTESGEYTGYPTFNSPDEIASDLKEAGVDLLLTANNHSYDTGDYGLQRTQDVLDQEGFVHIGTRESGSDRYIYVKLINGIRVGFVCYTYDTREYTDGIKSLNGIEMSTEAADLVNSFSYEALDEFYDNVKHDLYLMNMIGIEANIFYMHWGTEYEDVPNDLQMQMAQQMCELGVDVIVGGHPHVIQPFDILKSENGHLTACLYSMGNELSNQRAEYMSEDDYRGYTEDGIIWNVTFEKFNNGKVKLRSVKAVPTWVDCYTDEAGQTKYQILPLDDEAGNIDGEEEWNSYQRTMGRLGETYQRFR